MLVCLRSTYISTLLITKQTSRGWAKSQSPRLLLSPLLQPPKSRKMRGTNDPHNIGNGPGKRSHQRAPLASSSFGGSRGATTCHYPSPCLSIHSVLSGTIPAAHRMVFRAVQGVTHRELV